MAENFVTVVISDFEPVKEALNQAVLMRQALEAVEWVSDDGRDYCPWCGGQRPDDYDFTIAIYPNTAATRGHEPDCLRQRALGITG